MQILQATLPSQAAAAADSTTACLGQVATVGGTNNFVNKVSVVPPSGYTTVTGVATNNYTLTLRQVRAGAALVANFASIQGVSGVNLVAETPLSLTINATAAQQAAVQAGDMFDVLMHQNGTGLLVNANLVIQVEIA